VQVYDKHFSEDEIKGLLEFMVRRSARRWRLRCRRSPVKWDWPQGKPAARRLVWRGRIFGAEYPNAGQTVAGAGQGNGNGARRRNFGGNGASKPAGFGFRRRSTGLVAAAVKTLVISNQQPCGVSRLQFVV